MTLLKSSDSWKELKDLKRPLETRCDYMSSLVITTPDMKPGSVWFCILWRSHLRTNLSFPCPRDDDLRSCSNEQFGQVPRVPGLM